MGLDKEIEKLQKIIIKANEVTTNKIVSEEKQDGTTEENPANGSKKKKVETAKKSWFGRNWGWLVFGVVVVVVIGISGFCIYYFQHIDNVPQIADESEYE